MRTCNLCDQALPVSDFYLGSRGKPMARCKDYERHRDERKARQAAYARANPEKVAATRAAAVAKKPDQYRALSRLSTARRAHRAAWPYPTRSAA